MPQRPRYWHFEGPEVVAMDDGPDEDDCDKHERTSEDGADQNGFRGFPLSLMEEPWEYTYRKNRHGHVNRFAQ